MGFFLRGVWLLFLGFWGGGWEESGNFDGSLSLESFDGVH